MTQDSSRSAAEPFPVSSREDEVQSKKETLVKAYRLEQLRRSDFWILFVGGNVVVASGSFFNFVAWEWTKPWYLFQIGYFIVSSISVAATIRSWPFRLPQATPTIVCVGYVYAMVLTMLTWQTDFDSTHLNGLAQITLCLALVPITFRIFAVAVATQFAASVAVAHYMNAQFNLTLENSIWNLIQYYTIAGLTFFVVNNLRNKSNSMRAQLEIDKNRQSQIIERQSAELSRAKIALSLQQMLQMLAHDIRKPFTIIESGIKLLRRAESIEASRKITETLFHSAQKSMISVRAMLESLIDIDPRKRQVRELIKCTESILDAIEVSRHLENFENIEVQLELKSTGIIAADAHQISRVLSNIICNAAQAMRGTGIIRIRSSDAHSDTGEYVNVSVWNSNSYIEEMTLPNVFEPFVTAGKKDGTGLGLAIAKRLIEMHGGRIEVFSGPSTDAARSWVEFRIKLPAASTDGGPCKHE